MPLNQNYLSHIPAGVVTAFPSFWCHQCSSINITACLSLPLGWRPVFCIASIVAVVELCVLQRPPKGARRWNSHWPVAQLLTNEIQTTTWIQINRSLLIVERVPLDLVTHTASWETTGVTRKLEVFSVKLGPAHLKHCVLAVYILLPFLHFLSLFFWIETSRKHWQVSLFQALGNSDYEALRIEIFSYYFQEKKHQVISHGLYGHRGLTPAPHSEPLCPLLWKLCTQNFFHFFQFIKILQTSGASSVFSLFLYCSPTLTLSCASIIYIHLSGLRWNITYSGFPSFHKV